MFVFNKLSQFVKRSFIVKEEGGNKEFWFGQFIIIVSTVLGVYLAAYKGFEIAVDFDRLTHHRDSYYLQQSFYQELEDNTQTIDDHIIKIYDDTGSRHMLKHTADEMALDQFVWNAMQESEITFQIDPEILKSVRNFYRNYNIALPDVDSPDPYTQRLTIAKIKEMTTTIKKDTMPSLKDDIVVLKEKVRKAGMIDE